MSGFGTPANTGAFSFGNAPTSAANTQATTGFTFGAPKTAASALPAFGANLAQPIATTPATAFGFGTPAPTAAPTLGTPTNFNFPTSTSTTQPTLAFGAQAVGAAQATSSTTTSFNFGTPAPIATVAAAAAAAAPPPAATSAFSFGTTPTLGGAGGINTAAVPASTAATTIPTLGGLGGSTSFSFGKIPATTSASLNFNTTTTTATPFTGFNATGGGGLFGKPTTTTGGIGLATSAPATSTIAPTPFVGLGGIDITSTQPKSGDSKQDNVKVKETQVPDEISKTVDALKVYIKNQKTLSSDIGRTSTSKLSNVTGEILNLQWLLREIANSVETNYHQIKLLRKDTSRAIQTVEMAQRTQDTPTGLQYENVAPFQFFQNLIQKYESDLVNFRQQIMLTEKHMQSLTTPQVITPEDLKRGFKQINESFISLAGRLHEIHQKVEAQKEQFLNLRKYRLHDTTNVFAKLDNMECEVNTSTVTSGPTPFSNISGMNTFGKALSTNSGTGGTTTNQVGK